MQFVRKHLVFALVLKVVTGLRWPYSPAGTHPKRYSDNYDPDNFQWTDLDPSPNLRYIPCWKGFECARLEVPLDWNSTNSSLVDNLSIAVVRLPAKVPVTDPRYGGPVLINPGGPGGSGVAFAKIVGEAIQTMLDAAYVNGSLTYVVNSTDAKYFDIVGFDPRGVGSTTPFLACGGDAKGVQAFMSEGKDKILGTPEGPLSYLWARAVAANNNCFKGPAITPNGSRIADFITTTSTARDMIELVERHGEWLEGKSNGTIKRRPGEEPLLFYGVSYGSVLGATVAAMQPHRVKRFILDGVASSKEYYAGTILKDNMQADDMFQRLFEYCALAGPDKCGLSAGNKSTDTERHLQAIFDDIQDNGPIPVWTDSGPQVITLSDLKHQTTEMLYGPLTTFQTFAKLIGPLAQRNGSEFAISKASDRKEPLTDSNVDPYNAATNPVSFSVISNAIIGADSNRTFRNVSSYEPVWHSLQQLSHWAGDAIAFEYLSQFSWPSTPKWRFSDTHSIASNSTAHPILFASNLVDGVTSYQSAQEMTAAFPNSGLLLNDGEGHATSSSPSMCVLKKMRNYFQTGRLPVNLTEPCLPYERPFLGSSGPRTAPFNKSGASLEDVVLYNAFAG